MQKNLKNNIYKYINKRYIACHVAQMVKNLQKTGVQSLGQEDPLKKGRATHSSVLAWRIPRIEGLPTYSPWDRKELDMTE